MKQGSTPDTSAPAPVSISTSDTTTDPSRKTLCQKLDLFSRSLLPPLIRAQNGDDDSIQFLSDKITFSDSLKKKAAAAKASPDRPDLSVNIKKVDQNSIAVDDVKKEARVMVEGELVSIPKGGSSPTITPTNWLLVIKLPGDSSDKFLLSEVLVTQPQT